MFTDILNDKKICCLFTLIIQTTSVYVDYSIRLGNQCKYLTKLRIWKGYLWIKDRFYTHMPTLKGSLAAGNVPLGYWLQRDLLLKRFQCKLWGTNSTILVLCKKAI